MSTMVPQNAPTWRVTTSVEETDMSNPANPVPSQRVSFALDELGVSGSVLIPDARIGDLAYSRSVIAAKAAQLAALAGLTSAR